MASMGGCGCGGSLKRKHGAPAPVRAPWYSGPRTVQRSAGAASRSHAAEHGEGEPCCDACALGLECGAEVPAGYSMRGAVEVEARARGVVFVEARNPFGGMAMRAMAMRAVEVDAGDERDAGNAPAARDGEDIEDCPRNRGESVDAYRRRCGVEATGMNEYLWSTMSTGERRVYLQAVAQTARLNAQQERQLIAQTINGGFGILRQGIAAIRDVRIEEIRAGRDIAIAQIRGARAGELDYLGWSGGSANGPGFTQPPPVAQTNPVATIGIAAVLAKVAGVW